MVNEFTSEWLTRALRQTGVLRSACVRAVKHEPLGEGEGFMGQVFRLHLAFDLAEAGAPATLIAKIPTNIKQNRAVGELLGAYEREILFYESLAPRLSLRTPRMYYSAMEGSRTSSREAAGAAFIDNYPIWLIRLVMRFVTWSASRRTRRYVLLIEDLEPGQVGDQIAGCSSAEAGHVLGEMAKAHAQFWRNTELQQCYWLRAQNLNPRTMHSMFLKNRPDFVERFRDTAPANFEPSVRWLEQNAVELQRTFYATAPETLLHGDMRLDNVTFFPAEEPEPQPVVLFDWQLAGRGPGIYDIAYFLSGALTSDVSSESVVELVRGYHGTLVALGIDDYPFDTCLRDYRRALLSVLHRISSTDTLELGDDRGARLIALWLERTLEQLRDVDYDSLLTA